MFNFTPCFCGYNPHVSLVNRKVHIAQVNGGSVKNLLFYDLDRKYISIGTDLKGTISCNVFDKPNQSEEINRLLWGVVNNYKIFEQKNIFCKSFGQLMFENCKTNKIICKFDPEISPITLIEISPSGNSMVIASHGAAKVFEIDWDSIRKWDIIKNTNKMACTQICDQLCNVIFEIQCMQFLSDNQLFMVKGKKLFVYKFGHLIQNNMLPFKSYDKMDVEEKQLTHNDFKVRDAFYNSYNQILFVISLHGQIIMYSVENSNVFTKKNLKRIRKLVIQPN